jgi:hypothetical protein
MGVMGPPSARHRPRRWWRQPRDAGPGWPPTVGQEDVHASPRLPVAGLGLLLSLAAAPVAAGGPPSLAFYVDGVRYRTVGTPTDFSGTGAPAHSFDTIYALGGELPTSPRRSPAMATSMAAAGW